MDNAYFGLLEFGNFEFGYVIEEYPVFEVTTDIDTVLQGTYNIQQKPVTSGYNIQQLERDNHDIDTINTGTHSIKNIYITTDLT